MTTLLGHAASTGEIGPNSAPIISSSCVGSAAAPSGQSWWDDWPEMGSSGSLVLSHEAIDRALRRSYLWLRPQAISLFLRTHPDVGFLLLEAHEQIGLHFGPSVVTLNVAADPDGNDPPRLVVRVRTELAPEQALAKLDQFDSDWWLEASWRASDQVCITLEYQ